MSRAGDQADLQQETQQLLQGPLKHVKAAALAAALVPLASVAATPAAAQELCASAGTVCGMVWNDVNKNGVQDAGEPGIEGAKVFLYDGTETLETDTGPGGLYYFFVPDGTYAIYTQVPTGTQPSPPDIGGDDTTDSDGIPDGYGNSVAENVILVGDDPTTDFGFFTKPVVAPGTGTPGYWKNHPEAWPDAGIIVGGVPYTKAEAISWLQKVGKDKTTTMFSSLVSAMLNVLIKNDASCVSSTIALANDWMAMYGPVGSGVPASSAAWREGEWMHQQMDDYNNGRLCAPHRK
jgi:hypothetical protein